LMLVLNVQTFIGLQGVGKDLSAGFDVVSK